jgi:hypothetical protein
VIGLALGIAAAAAVLYVNPLADGAAAAPSVTDRVLRYSLPSQVLAFALGEDASVLGQSGERGLWEETIARTAVLGLMLNDEKDQPAAIASRLIAASADTNLLTRGVLVNDFWLVTVPREGTFFVRADSNVWPFLKRTFLPVWLFDQPWSGPAEYLPTVGPGPDNTAVVTGVAGVFDGQDGSAIERYDVTALDPARHSAAVAGELYLHLPGTQIAAQE